MAFLYCFKNTFLLWVLILSSCGNQTKTADESEKMAATKNEAKIKGEVIVAANRTSEYLKLLKNKSVGVVANQTSVIF